MTPEEHTQAIGDLRDDLSAIAQALAEIRGTLNDGLKLMVAEHKVELATIKAEMATISHSVTSHIAKEDVIFEIFRKTLSVGVTITAGLVAVLLSIIGWLLTHPGGIP